MEVDIHKERLTALLPSGTLPLVQWISTSIT
jgi:hypothetical protein